MVLINPCRWLSMKSYASWLPLGSTAVVHLRSAYVARSTLDNSTIPRLDQRANWIGPLTSFSFNSHSFIVFVRSTFCCSVNTHTSPVSSSTSHSPASTSSLASVTFSVFFKSSPLPCFYLTSIIRFADKLSRANPNCFGSSSELSQRNSLSNYIKVQQLTCCLSGL